MHLLKVWDSEYPWDVRAEKVMRTFSSAGHDVHLVARNRTHAKLEERLPEGTIHRLRPWHRLGRGLDAASQFPAFVNPRWLSHIRSTAIKTGADCILVRDLPLAPPAIWVARTLSIPVVLDMAENYPAMIRDIWTAGRRRAMDWMVRNPALVAAVERWVVRNTDAMVVVVEESRQRVMQLGANPTRITVVSNTPWPSRIPEELPVREDAEGPLRLVYLGLLEKPRGLDTAMHGLALLREQGTLIQLDVIGGGRDASLLRSMAVRLRFSDAQIKFHGVIPYEKSLEVVKAADIGLIPHRAVESWNTTIPNKLFDYMSVGLPVLTSDAKPAARIVREVHCGVVFRSDDVRDFARATQTLLDPVSRREMGLRGRTAVLERFNWNKDGKVLLDMVEGLVDAQP